MTPQGAHYPPPSLWLPLSEGPSPSAGDGSGSDLRGKGSGRGLRGKGPGEGNPHTSGPSTQSRPSQYWTPDGERVCFWAIPLVDHSVHTPFLELVTAAGKTGPQGQSQHASPGHGSRGHASQDTPPKDKAPEDTPHQDSATFPHHVSDVCAGTWLAVLSTKQHVLTCVHKHEHGFWPRCPDRTAVPSP